jgi:polyisoprenoid-binding protein YceI
VGGNRYSVAGKLTIKGRTRDVVVPATFTAQGATGVFAGSFTLRRGDFAIGEGAWSAFDVVANDVQVRFNIVAAGK